MLLGREDINPNQADTRNGRTPLSWAAEGQHEGVVKLLLEREDVNPNHGETKYGGERLLQAAINRHEGVVRMLLKPKDVNPNHGETKYDRMPLLEMADHWHGEAADLEMVKAPENDRDAMSDNVNQIPQCWLSPKGNMEL